LRVLFDNSIPRGLQRFFAGHEIGIAADLGWERLENGKLLAAAEEAGFDVLLTADQGIKNEQNLTMYKIAVVALGSNRWSLLKLRGAEIAKRVAAMLPCGYEFIDFPEGHKRGRA
jgi:hypothetical protein